VVVIIDPAMGQAEHTTRFFNAAANSQLYRRQPHELHGRNDAVSASASLLFRTA
jgi:hypothetical protein